MVNWENNKLNILISRHPWATGILSGMTFLNIINNSGPWERSAGALAGAVLMLYIWHVITAKSFSITEIKK